MSDERLPKIRSRDRRAAEPRAADLLIYGSLVRRIAARFRRVGSRDDLVQAGYIGLVHATRSFRAELGVPFEAYAARRIRGEIQDYLRAQLPKGFRRPASTGDAPRPVLISLSEPVTDGDEAERVTELVDGGPSPADVAAQRADLDRIGAAATRLLVTTDCAVLAALYGPEEASMAAVARWIGVHESRIRERHNRAIRRLRLAVAR